MEQRVKVNVKVLRMSNKENKDIIFLLKKKKTTLRSISLNVQLGEVPTENLHDIHNEKKFSYVSDYVKTTTTLIDKY